jgi:hypothetical protein
MAGVSPPILSKSISTAISVIPFAQKQNPADSGQRGDEILVFRELSGDLR